MSELDKLITNAELAGGNAMDFAKREIKRLTDELAETKNQLDKAERLPGQIALAAMNKWMPISGVKSQLDELENGFYLLRHEFRINGNLYSMMNYRDDEGCRIISDTHRSMPVAFTSYHEYKLIRAFDNSEESLIPVGAVLNTLENRINTENGDYLFVFSDVFRLYLYNAGHWTLNDRNYLPSDVCFNGAKYFFRVDRQKAIAALEAMAKENQL